MRAIWAEVRRTFRLPNTPWEEPWWSDEFLATGQWLGLGLGLVTFVGLLFLLHFPRGAGAFFVFAATGGVYVVALFGVAAYLRSR